MLPKRCWVSLRNDRILYYYVQTGIFKDFLGISVLRGHLMAMGSECWNLSGSLNNPSNVFDYHFIQKKRKVLWYSPWSKAKDLVSWYLNVWGGEWGGKRQFKFYTNASKCRFVSQGISDFYYLLKTKTRFHCRRTKTTSILSLLPGNAKLIPTIIFGQILHPFRLMSTFTDFSCSAFY